MLLTTERSTTAGETCLGSAALGGRLSFSSNANRSSGIGLTPRSGVRASYGGEHCAQALTLSADWPNRTSIVILHALSKQAHAAMALNAKTDPSYVPKRINGKFAPGWSGNPGGSLEATRRSFNKDFLLA